MNEQQRDGPAEQTRSPNDNVISNSKCTYREMRKYQPASSGCIFYDYCTRKERPCTYCKQRKGEKKDG